jgi:regulator of sigma E protease
MLDIVIFIAILALLVIAHESGHFGAARLFGIYVEEFGFGFPPKVVSKKVGEVTWSVNAIPLGGFVKIPTENGEDEEEDVDKSVSPDRLFYRKPVWKRAIVLAAGVAMNFILGWAVLSAVNMIGAAPAVFVMEVADKSPAKEAGLKPGDQILGFDTAKQLIDAVNASKGTQMTLHVRSSSQERDVMVVPSAARGPKEGALGVGLGEGGAQPKPFLDAIGAALTQAATMFSMIFITLFKLIGSIFGGENMFSQLSGPVGVFKITAQTSGMGLIYLANLVALISLNLAAVNIFPFPALDGGRIVFLLIEKLKGSPVSAKAQQIVNGVGFLFLIALMVALSVQDVMRLF